MPCDAHRGATTSIGHADVRTLVQTIANMVEEERHYEITKTTQIRLVQQHAAASMVRLRFTTVHLELAQR